MSTAVTSPTSPAAGAATTTSSSSSPSSLQSLTALGVTFNNDGTLSFDQSTLDAAFAANPSAVEQFFTTKTSGFSDQLNNLITQLAGKTNSLISDEVQGLQQTVTQNQQQITEMQAHLANEESQLYTQFYAMETAIAKLQNDLSVVQDISYIGADGSTTSTSNNTSSATPNLLTSGLSSIGGNSSNRVRSAPSKWSASARSARIFEEPLSTLTRTWFGDPVNGELCWGLATRLHHSIDSVEPTSWVAVCPILIENDSDTDLDFEKICVHVENLSIFRGPRRLWANSLNVIFKGPDQATQIEIVRTPPGFEQGLVLVSAARQPSAGWNIRKTFGMLKYFTDF